MIRHIALLVVCVAAWPLLLFHATDVGYVHHDRGHAKHVYAVPMPAAAPSPSPTPSPSESVQVNPTPGPSTSVWVILAIIAGVALVAVTPFLDMRILRRLGWRRRGGRM